MSTPHQPQSPSPLVSVVMTVYNGERFLEQAVESILNQTFTDFEFIIVDDGSTDTTPDILARIQSRDPRIRLQRNAQNAGIPASANRGCRMARGKYIARMDADDVSLPTRLHKQVTYLEQHPEVGILGCLANFIDEHGSVRSGLKERPFPPPLKWTLNFYCCLMHPTVLMRRDVVEKLDFYDPHFAVGGDYDLFLRAGHVTRLANLPQALFHFRLWAESTTRIHRVLLQDRIGEAQRTALSGWLDAEISAETASNLTGLTFGKYPATLSQIRETREVLNLLRLAFSRDPLLNASDIRAINLDASLKLWLLASRTFKHSFAEAFSLCFQAIRIHPLGVFLLAHKVAHRLTAPFRR